MNRERPRHDEIQPMSQKRRWMVRAGAETLAAVGLGLGLASGYEAVADHDFDMVPFTLVSVLNIEAVAGVVILKQLTAEKKNKQDLEQGLEFQRLLDRGLGLQAAAHYHLAEQREIMARMGLINAPEERPEPTDIPDVFRDAFGKDNPDDSSREIE